MRDDMARVIVERPRIPAFNSRKGRRQAWDDLPGQEGMRRSRAWRGDLKDLNENLTPLRRYLERQAGRPWDKVYAEIAAHLRVDSAVQQHVRDHLRDFVAVKPRHVTLSWYSRSGGREHADCLWRQPLYVDPATGLLCRTDRLSEEKARQRRTKQRAPEPACRIPIAGDRELRQIRGIWYEVQLAALPDPEYQPCPEVRKRPLKPYNRCSPVVEVALIVRRLITPAVRDVAANAVIEVGPPIDDEAGWNAYRRAQPDRRYAVAKRVLSRRELRRHGLTNLPAGEA
jgi:hypothetical protein